MYVPKTPFPIAVALHTLSIPNHILDGLQCDTSPFQYTNMSPNNGPLRWEVLDVMLTEPHNCIQSANVSIPDKSLCFPVNSGRNCIDAVLTTQ